MLTNNSSRLDGKNSFISRQQQLIICGVFLQNIGAKWGTSTKNTSKKDSKPIFYKNLRILCKIHQINFSFQTNRPSYRKALRTEPTSFRDGLQEASRQHQDGLEEANCTGNKLTGFSYLYITPNERISDI